MARDRRERALDPSDRNLIVGIGASAGGIAALEALFRGLPVDTGMGFVVITHQARGHESALPAILGRYTAMPVAAAVDGAKVEPNHVYICPPDYLLTLQRGRLHLNRFDVDVPRFPIDAFLASLAEEAGEAAVGIVLSGGGSDGTRGITAIKEHGGLTLAQGHNGSSPIHSTMPDSAIAAGVVDLVLTAEAMGPRLAAF